MEIGKDGKWREGGSGEEYEGIGGGIWMGGEGVEIAYKSVSINEMTIYG